ncbi:MAG: ATPase, T2SS/T4P/T4SS family [Erysipelotrichaceae bacterium]
MKNMPIGELLKLEGCITQEQLDQGLVEQKKHKDKRLGQILIDLGFISEEQMLEALAQRLHTEIVDLSTFPIDVKAISIIPLELARKYNMIGVEIKNGRLVVVSNDPLNFYAIEDIRLIAGMPIDVCLANKESIVSTIEYYYAEIKAKKAASDANKSVVVDKIIVEEFDDNDNTPIIKVLNSLLLKGYNANASDIHIEPYKNKTMIRMRIDGMILDYLELDRNLHNPLIARIKILSNLDIAEKRLPQDGHFVIKVEGYEMNVRVSLIPTVYGEKSVLRFLNANAKIVHKEHYGMSDGHYNQLKQMLNSPHGIIYLSGPTGSGKTTTLYMLLEELAKKQVNISTIEDPVERQIERVNQMQVNNLSGLNFETGLRALLRQDPDIIMVGETRDVLTAEISVRAAITGHLVLSTLHTNDAISSIVRLQDMGVEAYLLANSLVGVVAQRLLRTICPNCKEKIETTPLDQVVLGKDVDHMYHGSGCHICNGTGYKGRIAIHEVITIDKKMREMITNQVSTDIMLDYIKSKDYFISLRDEAIDLVKEGVTTMEELNRITATIE